MESKAKNRIYKFVAFILGMLTVEIFHFCANIGWDKSWLFLAGIIVGIAVFIMFLESQCL